MSNKASFHCGARNHYFFNNPQIRTLRKRHWEQKQEKKNPPKKASTPDMSSPTVHAATRTRTPRIRNPRLQGQGDVLAMAREFVTNRFFRNFNVDAFVYLVLSLSLVPPLLNWVETAFAAVSLAYGLRLVLAAVLPCVFDKYLTCPQVETADAAGLLQPSAASSTSAASALSASSPTPRFFVPRLLRQASQLVYHAWFVHAFAHRAAATAGNVGLGNLTVLVDIVAWTVWGHLCLQDHHAPGSVEDPKPVVRPLMWALFGSEALVAMCACLWPDSAAYALTQALLTMIAGAAAGIAVSSSVDLEHNAPLYSGIGLVFAVQCVLVMSPAARTVLLAARGGPAAALEHFLPFSSLLLLCLTSLIRDRLASATYSNPLNTVGDAVVRAAIVLLPLVLLYSGHTLALVMLVLCLMQQTGKEYAGPLQSTDPMELARKLLFAM